VPLVEQELRILPEQMSSSPVFSGVHVTRSLVLCVCFVDRCLSFVLFPFVIVLCVLRCRGRRGRDRVVVGFTTTYAISAYHH